MRYDSWMRTARKFQRVYPSAQSSSTSGAKAAFLYFLNHQMFHYLTENAASLLEIAAGLPLLYQRYYSDVYAELFNTNLCLEEALANSYLLQQATHYHMDMNYIQKELLRQGEGYNKFINYQGNNFLIGIRHLISQIKQCLAQPKKLQPLEQIMDIYGPHDSVHDHRLPVWLHHESKPLNRM